MSYKDQRKELGLETPSGSKQDLTSTMDGSKWHHGVDGVGIAKLTKISGEINKVMEDTANVIAKAQIKVGRLLNEARELIPGDLQFGKWREANTSITNKSTANKLMNLAKQVGEGRITQDLVDALPMSTLKELISAPDSVISHVREQLKDDPTDIPTRNEVRELGKEVQGVVIEAAKGAAVSPATPKPSAAPGVKEIMSVRAVVEMLLKKKLIERVKHLDPKNDRPYPSCQPLEWAYLVFGLDPDPAVNPSPDTMEVLLEAFHATLEAADDEEGTLCKTLGRAYELVCAAE